MASFVSIVLLLFLASFCKSDNQITGAKPLTSNDTLISKNSYFALGFFSPSSSSNKTLLYLGIWYNNIPGSRTVVWIANRDKPITTTPSSSPMLTITNDSSSTMTLSDSNGDTLWVPESDSTAGGVGAYAVLLDTGNFVLRSSNGADLWQSFDHPTDTILPTMKFLQSYKGKAMGKLVAWKGLDDPSSGNFSFSGDPVSPTLQRFIWKGNQPYCRAKVVDGLSTLGVTEESNRSSMINSTNFNQGDRFYMMFTVPDGIPFTRATLDYTGKLKFLLWRESMSSWTSIYELAKAECDLYASCGPFGYCDSTGTSNTPTCRCLDGFEPANGLNFSSGCRRTQKLECGNQSHFNTLTGMKIPDKFLHVKNRSLDECKAECSGNCSCKAYAYADLSSVVGANNGDPSRCLIWTEDLIDTAKSKWPGENLYLRLANSPVGEKRKSVLNILLPVAACLLVLACIFLVWICKFRGMRRKKDLQKKSVLEYLSTSNELGDENIELPFVSFADIVAATNDFSEDNMLGQGGFGKVYKGILNDDKEVAIKRLSKSSGQGAEEFRTEVVLIAKLQHRNLVRLLGCCIHGDEKLLIYEYLPNKSLDAFIFDTASKSVLDWPTRSMIIKGVARGLLYLHQDSRLRIIHRDLKASNILLDVDMSPKISDFGMARIFSSNQQEANTNRVVGTYGYMSPEYAMDGAFSVKSDTYSFGVILLEIISGLKISSLPRISNFPNLLAYAWSLWRDDKAAEMVDSSISGSCSPAEAVRCIHIGLLCVHGNPEKRPLMSSVVFMLENDTAALPSPEEPLYFARRNPEKKEAGDNTSSSSNTMSLTVLEGR